MEINFEKMNEIGINNYIRSIISTNMNNDNEIERILFVSNVQNLMFDNSKKNRFLSDLFASILFLDRYKNLYDAVTSGYYDRYNLEEFDYYDKVNSIFDIKYLYSYNSTELYYALESCTYFNDCPVMIKSSLMNNLTNADDSYLNGIAKYHQLDVDNYKRILSLNELYDYVVSEREAEDNDYDYVYMLNIVAYLQKNFFSNPNEILKIVSEIEDKVISNYSKLYEGERKNYHIIIDKKEKTNDEFKYTCIYNKNLLNTLVLVYTIMRDRNIINEKKLIKE